MGNCLVKKLQTTVDDENLMGLGEACIDCLSTDNGIYRILVNSSIEQTIKVYDNQGNCYDTHCEENVEKYLVCNSTSTQDSDGYYHYKVKFENIYNLNKFYLTSSYFRAKFDLGILKYNNVFLSFSHGEYISNTVTGDIANLFKPSLYSIYMLNNNGVYGDFNGISKCANLHSFTLGGTQMHGDLSAVSELTNLNTLSIPNNNLTGNISSLQNLTNLTKLNISGNNITGNLGDISSCTKLKEINLPDGVTYTQSQKESFPNLTSFIGGTLIS